MARIQKGGIGQLLLLAYFVMAYFVGDSRSRCGEERDAYGLVKHNVIGSIFYGTAWPLSVGVYWSQHGRIGDFFSRAERADCNPAE